MSYLLIIPSVYSSTIKEIQIERGYVFGILGCEIYIHWIPMILMRESMTPKKYILRAFEKCMGSHVWRGERLMLSWYDKKDDNDLWCIEFQELWYEFPLLMTYIDWCGLDKYSVPTKCNTEQNDTEVNRIEQWIWFYTNSWTAGHLDTHRNKWWGKLCLKHTLYSRWKFALSGYVKPKLGFSKYGFTTENTGRMRKC